MQEEALPVPGRQRGRRFESAMLHRDQLNWELALDRAERQPTGSKVTPCAV
jgi:hypothetical protein